MYHYGLYKEVPYGLENTAVIFAFCHMLVLTFHTQNKEKHMPWQTIITNIKLKAHFHIQRPNPYCISMPREDWVKGEGKSLEKSIMKLTDI